MVMVVDAFKDPYMCFCSWILLHVQKTHVNKKNHICEFCLELKKNIYSAAERFLNVYVKYAKPCCVGKFKCGLVQVTLGLLNMSSQKQVQKLVFNVLDKSHDLGDARICKINYVFNIKLFHKYLA